MGSCISVGDKIEPEDVELNQNDAEAFRNKRRYTTDVIFFFLHSFALVFLIPLLLYCVVNGNIYRIINGYDSCLNVCGRDNDFKSNQSQCSGHNMKEKPYILVFKPDGKNSYKARNLDEVELVGVPGVLNETLQRACLKNCSTFPYYTQLLNRCVLERNQDVSDTILGKSGIKDFFEEVSEDFELCWFEILYLCTVSLVFSFLIMVLLRFVVGLVVWLVLIGVTFASISGTVYLWFKWKESKDEEKFVGEIETQRTSSYLAFSIIATIISVCIVLLILVMRKRIQLVIQLFKEAGKAVAAMPLLLFQPVITFLCIVTTIGFWIYFTLWIESAGHSKKIREDFYIFEKNFLIQFTRWYNIFITLWMIQFIIGCQHIVIAGAVSTWYFTRAKTSLGSPIFYSFYNLTRYHLGSVSFGSLLISLVQFARICLSLLQKYLKTHNGNCVDCLIKCCQCCLCCLEKILKFLTTNAYIEIAIHGSSFCEGGKQAFKILSANALRVAAINSVGDFVLFLGKIIVIVATIVVGIELIQKKEGILHAWVPLTLSGLFAYFIAHCFLSVYEMAIDTIFICFCEDSEQNDGISKPYYMSRNLMEFVENSKKSLLNNGINEAWKEQPIVVNPASED